MSSEYTFHWDGRCSSYENRLLLLLGIADGIGASGIEQTLAGVNSSHSIDPGRHGLLLRSTSNYTNLAVILVIEVYASCKTIFIIISSH